MRLTKRAVTSSPALSSTSRSPIASLQIASIVNVRRTGRKHLQPSKPPSEAWLQRIKEGSVKGKEKVVYTTGGDGFSHEQRSFFANDIEGEIGGSASGYTAEDQIRGLKSGRVVEIRRSGFATLGLILGSIISDGRPRLLALRATGDIWPVSAHDVQFVMPPNLISPKLASQCWTPELIQEYGRGDVEAISNIQTDEMMSARRKVVTILRKVSRETERMNGKLLSGGGGIEEVWEKYAPNNPDQRTNVTAVQAAQFLLNKDIDREQDNPIVVKANTLPAFAAHGIMMRRADLFLGDQGDMWETGKFMVRSRSERKRYHRVEKWLEGSTPEDRAIMDGFIEKARTFVKKRQQGGQLEPILRFWSPTDLDIINVLISGLFETRSTQIAPSLGPSVSVLRKLDAYPGEVADKALVAQLLGDIGIIPSGDSLNMSKAMEAENRDISTSGLSIKSSSSTKGLLQGNELDTLREDFESHTVYVIDDANASELDDGVSFESAGEGRNWIHVHIADPTRFLPPSHKIARTANFRGSSVYLPEGNLPLLPFSEVMSKLSLGSASEEKGQGVLTFSILIDKGEIVDGKIRLGWIKNPKITTYSAVDEALGISTGKTSRPFGLPPISESSSSNRKEIAQLDSKDRSDLRELHNIALESRRKRLSQAGLEYTLPSANVSLLGETPQLQNLFVRENLPTSVYASQPTTIDYTVGNSQTTLTAANMIAELMVMAGQVAAKFLSDRNIPAPFRGSEAPVVADIPGKHHITTIEDLLAERDPQMFVDPFKVLAANLFIPSSTVSTSPQRHWAMGLHRPQDMYVRATSPLRRYEDLLVHWQIKNALALEKKMTTPYKIDNNSIEEVIQRAEFATKRIKKLDKTATAYWQAGSINSRLTGPLPSGWTVTPETVDLREPIMGKAASASAVLSTGQPAITQVYIQQLGLVARLAGDPSKRFAVGEEMSVRVKKADQWPAPLVEVELA